MLHATATMTGMQFMQENTLPCWTVLCSAFALRARNGLHAALLNLCLLIPTLMSYFFACHVFGLYMNRMILQFGALLLLPAAGAAWLLRAFRDEAWLRPVLLTAGFGLLAFDLQNGILRSPADLRLLLPLLVMFIYSVVSAPAVVPQPYSKVLRKRMEAE